MSRDELLDLIAKAISGYEKPESYDRDAAARVVYELRENGLVIVQALGL